MVGEDARDLQHLIQHTAMLRRNTDAAIETVISLQRMNQRE